MRIRMLAVVAAILFVPGITLADHHTEKERMERAGNCDDAKKQMEYFCDESNAANDNPQGRKPLIQPINRPLNGDELRPNPFITPHIAEPCHQRIKPCGMRRPSSCAAPRPIISTPTAQPTTDCTDWIGARVSTHFIAANTATPTNT